MKWDAPAEAQAHATARYREASGRYFEGKSTVVGVAQEARSVGFEGAVDVYQKPLG